MKYYLVLSENIVENSKDLFVDKYLLVEKSFDTVYTKTGFRIFERLLDNEAFIEEMSIYNEEGDEVSIKEFIEFLEGYDLRYDG